MLLSYHGTNRFEHVPIPQGRRCVQGGLLREQLQISEGALLSMAGICISGTSRQSPCVFADHRSGVKHVLKFALTEPTLIYRSKITNDGNIITDVFPSKNNTYSDVLLPLSSYSGSTTISVANIKNVIKKYSPSARVNGLNKEKLLQLLEDIRKTNNITNADLCNKFADEIYLPKIVLKKADIPLSLRSQFIDLR